MEKVERFFDSLKTGKSPMVDSWFMMSGPTPIISVIVAYVLFIILGPKFMKNRLPMKMNSLLAYYNAFQVFLAATISVKVLRLSIFKDGIIYAGCRYPSHTQNPLLLDVGWWYFFAKITELLDTIFFVLRKKNSQVTFLHVYHHVVMAIYSWSYLKFAAGGEGAVLALLNSLVHIVMYTYYLLAGLGPRFQKYLWWKKYVTKMQLLQFILMLSYCVWTYFSPRCQFATGFTYFIVFNVTMFLLLFLNFYSKSYKKQRDAKKEIEEEYRKNHNGIKKNIAFESNGVAKDKYEKANGLCIGDHTDANIEAIPHEIISNCGDYVKDSKVFLTRRTAKAAFGADVDFDSIKKK